jgi:hypothetical protein
MIRNKIMMGIIIRKDIADILCVPSCIFILSFVYYVKNRYNVAVNNISTAKNSTNKIFFDTLYACA